MELVFKQISTERLAQRADELDHSQRIVTYFGTGYGAKLPVEK